MKNFAIAIAACAAMFAAPAMARDFTGPRVELTAGVNDVENFNDKNDISYGAVLGVDFEVLPRFVVGVEAQADNVFDRHTRSIGAAARVGYAVTDNALVYVKGGYANYEDAFSRKLDGLRVGGGVDLNVAGPFYVGAEYRLTDLEKNVKTHQGLVKVGIRF